MFDRAGQTNTSLMTSTFPSILMRTQRHAQRDRTHNKRPLGSVVHPLFPPPFFRDEELKCLVCRSRWSCHKRQDVEAPPPRPWCVLVLIWSHRRMCESFSTAAQGGDFYIFFSFFFFCHDPHTLQSSQIFPPTPPLPSFLFFRKRCVGANVPPAAHCYLSSRRKQLLFLLDVFLCLFGLLFPFSESKEGKNRYQVVRRKVFG